MVQTDIEIATPLIQKWEGLRLKPYYCSAGYPTIGWGHVVADISHPPITREQADKWLEQDTAKAKLQLLTASPCLVNTTAQRRAALISFVFNLGIGRYRSSTLRKKVQEGDWEAAKREIQKWVFGGGKKLPGLVSRRAEEALLLDIG